MKFTKEVYDALVHVRQFHPDVEIVVYTSDGRWHYVTEDFNLPTFDPKIDVGILEDAADSLEQFPAVFEFYQYQ